MNVERKIKALNDELRAIKAAYSQVSFNLIIYTYVIDVEYEYGVVDKEITFVTDDGSDALVTVEGASYRRLPYSGGAKLYLGNKLGEDAIKLFTIQKGTVVIS